eukprot:c20906_g1_i2 orf=330-1952(-)
MLAFGGPPPHLARLAPQRPPNPHLLNVTRLNKRPDHLLAFDSDGDDDDDDADDFSLLDTMEEFCFEDVKQKIPSKLPLPQPLTTKKPLKFSVPNTPHVKKAVKVVPKRPTTSELSKLKPLNGREWGRPLKPVRSNHGSNQFAGLSGCTWEERAQQFIRNKKLKESLAGAQQVTKAPETVKAVISLPKVEVKAVISLPKQNTLVATDNLNLQLLAGLELEQRCQPVVEYLISLGLNENNLQKIARRRRACFYVKISKVKERLGYLMSLGIKNEDISKVLTRHPQVLEYTVDRMMKPRVQYLQSIGVPETRLGRVITVSPSLLECSLEGSLKRRVRFLVEEVGVSEGDVWKIVLLSPQVLTQSINNSLRPRINFLLKKVGLSQERVTKMIMKHPQLLHYSIKNGIQPRIDFLRSIGLSDRDIAIVLSRSSQVLSLSVEKSLKPKCDYLTKELNCGLQTIVSFPAYLSLSLEQRIKPRHKFLKSLNRLPAGPFSMHILAVTDDEYCKRWAKSTVEEYCSFRQSLLLSNFAKQFAKRNRLQFDT